VRVDRACVEKDYYIIEDDEGNKNPALEDALQKIESYSARRIARLVENPARPRPTKTA
jgi:hypothetical protein